MKVFLIAEIGSVHDGSFGNAQRLVDLAVECGADAVKFQTHIPEAETLRSAPAPAHFKDEERFEYFRRTGFSGAQWSKLKAHCDQAGIAFMSSPFSIEAVDLLSDIGMETYKIPSGEVTNLPLLRKIAGLRKPVLLSSGMNSWSELDSAVEVIKSVHSNLTVLQCTSEYPCPYEHAGLNLLAEIQKRYRVPAGFSDHTRDNYAAFAAVALGATTVEKHLTFSKKMYGSDAPFAIEPAAFKDLSNGIRAIEKMSANPVDKDDVARFASMKETFEKSIVTQRDLPAGQVLAASDLACKKPGTGISAARFDELVGKRILRAVSADSLLSPADIDWNP